MKIPLSIRPTRDKRRKNTIHHVYDTEHREQRIVYYAHRDKRTEQRNAHYVYDIKHTEHNVLDTIFLYLYNDERFFK